MGQVPHVLPLDVREDAGGGVVVVEEEGGLLLHLRLHAVVQQGDEREGDEVDRDDDHLRVLS